MADNRNWTNGFWVEYPGPHGQTLTPSHLALFLRFVNLEGVSTHIASFAVDIKSGSEWIRLTRLPMDTVFDAYPTATHPTVEEALKNAVRLDFSSYGLESQIDKVDGLLKPTDMVRGWALFEYPPPLQQIGKGDIPIRVTVEDVKGLKAIHVHYRQVEEQNKNDMVLKQLLKTQGVADISGLYRKHWSDPN